MNKYALVLALTALTIEVMAIYDCRFIRYGIAFYWMLVSVYWWRKL